MTGLTPYYLTLSISFAISLVTLIAVIISPKTNSTHFYISNVDKLDPKIVKMVNILGGDLLSIIPSKIQRKSITSKEIDNLFKASGNPWGVSKLEFFVLRATYGFSGLAIGVLFSLLVRPSGLLSGIIIVALTYLGWNKPVSTYRTIANAKEADFKRNFPEMLDYLTMVMSDGTFTFANAIEIILPYLPESAVKTEFKRVTDSINVGMDVEIALKELAGRLPSPSLEAFVNAVNNANSLNTPMDDLMRIRAKKSREDLKNEMQLIIQGLPTKTMLTIAPAAILSMLLIFMVPVVIALLQTL